MDKYFRYEDVKEYICSFYLGNECDCDGSRCKKLDRLPIADVAPVVHAYWDFTPAAPWYPKCSSCGYQIIMPYTDDNYPNYCPNCGAKMDEEYNNNSSLNIAKEIISEYYKKAKYGIFSSRNVVGDAMTPLYRDSNLIIDICYPYEYFEVFGLSEDEFDELYNFYHSLK